MWQHANIKNAIILTCCFIIVVMLFNISDQIGKYYEFNRYEIAAGQGPYVWRLDRKTGQVSLIPGAKVAKETGYPGVVAQPPY